MKRNVDLIKAGKKYEKKLRKGVIPKGKHHFYTESGFKRVKNKYLRIGYGGINYGGVVIDYADVVRVWFKKDRFKELIKKLENPTVSEYFNGHRIDLLFKMCKFLTENRHPSKNETYHMKLDHFVKHGNYYNSVVYHVDEKSLISHTHYVYNYVVDGVVKYVGKGSLRTDIKRALQIQSHNAECIRHHLDIVVWIVGVFISEQKALEHESVLIAEYGLHNLWNKKG